MRTTVVTLKDDRLEEKCYDIIIQVLDTNECEHSDSIEWAHQCDASSKCVNTEGSYFCACGGEYFLKRTAECALEGHINTGSLEPDLWELV